MSYEECTKFDISPEDSDFDKQFINAIKFAVDNGEGKDYKFGRCKGTIEEAYNGMLTIREQGIDVWDECIEAYLAAFIMK